MDSLRSVQERDQKLAEQVEFELSKAMDNPFIPNLHFLESWNMQRIAEEALDVSNIESVDFRFPCANGELEIRYVKPVGFIGEWETMGSENPVIALAIRTGLNPETCAKLYSESGLSSIEFAGIYLLPFISREISKVTGIKDIALVMCEEGLGLGVFA